jgi:hypothetical protein
MALAAGYRGSELVHYLVLLDRMEEARAAADELRKADPNLTLAVVRKRFAGYSSGYRERRLATLRAAGIPE